MAQPSDIRNLSAVELLSTLGPTSAQGRNKSSFFWGVVSYIIPSEAVISAQVVFLSKVIRIGIHHLNQRSQGSRALR